MIPLENVEAAESAVEEMIEAGLVARLPGGVLAWTEMGKKVVESLSESEPELFAKLFKEMVH